MDALYDLIGSGYAAYRRPEPRIAALITAALGDAASVVNLGAGVGSYEPRERRVVAVEPSRVMLAQRPTGAAPAVRARVEALPFADAAFDVALATLTLHHWSDRVAGLREAQRVAQRVVLLTWIGFAQPFWLLDYLPEIAVIDAGLFPTLAELADLLGPLHITPVPIPADCSDGFLCAYWRRPERYLDAGARSAISSMARLSDIESGLSRLRDDLASGVWKERHRALLSATEMDYGYRLVVAAAPGAAG